MGDNLRDSSYAICDDDPVAELTPVEMQGPTSRQKCLAFMARPAKPFITARLVGAFDASGKEDQRLLLVAGFISRAIDWQSFHKEWLARLAQDGLSHFHMVDFAACQRQFLGWRDNETRRRTLFGDLMGIIKAHVYCKFGCAIENDQFYALSPANQQEFALNAYSLAGRTCVADVYKWKARNGLGHVPTGYVFEEGDEGAGLLVQRMEEDGHATPRFKPKVDRVEPDGSPINAYTPLQAADILAYEFAKPYKDVLAGNPPSKFRWGFDQLNHIPGEIGTYSPRDLRELNEKLNELSLKRQHCKDAIPST